MSDRLNERLLYYKELDEFPTQSNFEQEIFTDLTDNGFRIVFVIYGYINLSDICKLSDDLLDGNIYSKNNTSFKYAIYLNKYKVDDQYSDGWKATFKENYEYMMDKLKYFGNYNCQYYKVKEENGAFIEDIDSLDIVVVITK